MIEPHPCHLKLTSPKDTEKCRGHFRSTRFGEKKTETEQANIRFKQEPRIFCFSSSSLTSTFLDFALFGGVVPRFLLLTSLFFNENGEESDGSLNKFGRTVKQAAPQKGDSIMRMICLFSPAKQKQHHFSAVPRSTVLS